MSEIPILLFFCKSNYKWKSLLWWQQNNVKTPIAYGLFWLNDIASGLQDPGWTNQNQKK